MEKGFWRGNPEEVPCSPVQQLVWQIIVRQSISQYLSQDHFASEMQFDEIEPLLEGSYSS
jgi:hypothetical protein